MARLRLARPPQHRRMDSPHPIRYRLGRPILCHPVRSRLAHPPLHRPSRCRPCRRFLCRPIQSRLARPSLRHPIQSRFGRRLLYHPTRCRLAHPPLCRRLPYHPIRRFRCRPNQWHRRSQSLHLCCHLRRRCPLRQLSLLLRLQRSHRRCSGLRLGWPSRQCSSSRQSAWTPPGRCSRTPPSPEDQQILQTIFGFSQNDLRVTEQRGGEMTQTYPRPSLGLGSGTTSSPGAVAPDLRFRSRAAYGDGKAMLTPLLRAIPVLAF